MSLFNRKQKIKLEDFCRNFYDHQIVNPVASGAIIRQAFPELEEKIDPVFRNINEDEVDSEFMALGFELFSLAWTHKFVSGLDIVNQSVFTKKYLHEKGKDDIWNRMNEYNEMINCAVLDWLSKLGKMNMSFNYNMIRDLGAKNIEDAQKKGIAIDESVERVNKRTFSENAWRQKFILGPIVATFCSRLGIDVEKIDKETITRLAISIRGLYDDASQALNEVRIEN